MKCKVEKLCGGCQLLKVGREEQAKGKEKRSKILWRRRILT